MGCGRRGREDLAARRRWKRRWRAARAGREAEGARRLAPPQVLRTSHERPSRPPERSAMAVMAAAVAPGTVRVGAMPLGRAVTFT